MSVIGPRPGLWNQDILTAERDKYGASSNYLIGTIKKYEEHACYKSYRK